MSKSLLLRGVVVTAALGLTLSACTTDDPDEPGDGTEAGCEAYADYQGNDGTTVSIYTPITEPESTQYEASWDEFESCTGITITYEGTDQFEEQLRVRAQGGNPPDLAFMPQPGLIAEMVEGGFAVPAPAEVATLAEQNWAAGWTDYSTVDGTFYGAPMSANMKSLVWYSPSYFAENSYQIPATFQDLITLSDTIAGTGTKPWCAGIGSDAATGWPATDWVEDVFLRLHGPEAYQQWIDHAIPFNDPMVVEAFDTVGQILKNPDYVNGGLGDVSSIATTSFEDAGLPILDDECAMHRQASFYGAQWGDATVAEDGDVFAFYFPVIDPAGATPVLGGGEFVVAFADRPEVVAVQTYLATGEYHTARAEQGAWASANNQVPVETYTDPVFRLVADTMQDPEAQFAFDASDLMPGEIGGDYLFSQITEWIVGQDTQTTVTNVENNWPA
ncbi:MAG: ABC transporter substrate-binding protein [Natronosporangium sp.]